MLRVYVVDLLGEQQYFVGSTDPNDVIATLKPDERGIIFPPPTEDARWDFETKEWVPRPPKPTPDHAWDPSLAEWIAPPLGPIRERKWEAIKRARDAAEASTFTWNGHVFDADRTRINGAVTGALIARESGIPYTDTWTLANNSTITVTGEDLLSIGRALIEHVSACHAKARALRELINQASTYEQIEAINWSTL